MATTKTHILHLIAWAQIGVLLRVHLGLVLGAACNEGGWVPCVTSPGTRDGGALFTDLPANILGCFLMGLFVSSDVLSSSLKHTLTVEAPLAMLSVRSPLQTHLPLHVGLRTGLCGSLTTFASWNLQMIIMFVGGAPVHTTSSDGWVQAIAALLIGTLCAMASLVVGQHVALMIYHELNPGALIPYCAPVAEQLSRLAPDSKLIGASRHSTGAEAGNTLFEEDLVIAADDSGRHMLGSDLRTFSCPTSAFERRSALGKHMVLKLDLHKEQHLVRRISLKAAASGREDSIKRAGHAAADPQDAWVSQLKESSPHRHTGTETAAEITAGQEGEKNVESLPTLEVAEAGQQPLQRPSAGYAAGTGSVVLDRQLGPNSRHAAVGTAAAAANAQQRGPAASNAAHLGSSIHSPFEQLSQQQELELQQLQHTAGPDPAGTQQLPGHQFEPLPGHVSIDSRRLHKQLQPSQELVQSSSGLQRISKVQSDASIDGIIVEQESDTETGRRAVLPLAADAFAGTVAVVLTAISLWRVIHGSLRSDLVDVNSAFAAQWIWWAVLLGPIGCYIRYYLARYNGVLSSAWSWFPLGTFTANISACVMDYALKAALVRAPLSTVDVAVMTGVICGVGGCLSTVSTWVVEIQRLLLTFPNTHHGYNYVLISFVTSIGLGLIIYGVPVWTMHK